jgi:Immediate early response protein (IER)
VCSKTHCSSVDINLKMATEAQRLIGISLAKIAQSRMTRAGVSLHKNLLVATVLQKARYIFMEEAYQMVHGHYLQAGKCYEQEVQNANRLQHEQQQENRLAPPMPVTPPPPAAHQQHHQQLNHHHHHLHHHHHHHHHHQLQPQMTCSDLSKEVDKEPEVDDEVRQNSNADKENNPPSSEGDAGFTYLDLDINKIQKSSDTTTSVGSGKRRRETTETEEAVLSILPKRIKSESTSSDESDTPDTTTNSMADDDVFDEVATNLSKCVARETMEQQLDIHHPAPSIEGIDRITSLVSIFSFGNLQRSNSSPDLCSAQAKDASDNNSIGQRTFLAMTV